jgi:1-acyl-sn-glycerol-3-phosphate acyltransferase
MYAIYYWIVLLIIEPVMFITGLIILLLTFPFDPNRSVLHYHSYVWGLLHFWINPWWRIYCTGKENVNKKKPYIIVSNHQSMLDICLMYTIPRQFKWVSKKEALKIPIVGWALWLHRDILINRGEGASVKRMISEAQQFLKDTVCITIFPEGTRTKDGRIHEFKEGAFLLSRLTKTAILPVVIDGTYDVMPNRGFSFKRKQKFYVKILPEISEEEVAKTSVKDMAARLHAIMLAEHKKIAPEKYAGL